MKNKKQLCIILTVCISTIVIFALFVLEQSSIQHASAGEPSFNLIFQYGYGDELNTFKGSYTKDMFGRPSITTNLSLSKEDLDKIYQKMVEINFFDYPDKFSAQVHPGDGASGRFLPPATYYFKVEYDSKINEVSWIRYYVDYEDAEADRLVELIDLIINIIQSKEEYKRLPSFSSERRGYL